MRDILTVAKFTAKDLIGRKSFRISTIIILALIFVGSNIPNIIKFFSQDDSSQTTAIVDRDNLYEGTLTELPTEEHIEVSQASDEELKQKIQDGDLKNAIIIHKTGNTVEFRYLVKNLVTAGIETTNLKTQLEALYKDVQLQKLHLSATELAAISPHFAVSMEQTDEAQIGGNIYAMMILSCVLFFAIYFCAFQVSSSITTEKTSKIVETLVTSTSPKSIIYGKTLGIGVVGLLQILLFVVTAIICAYCFMDHQMLEQLFDLSNFTPYLAIVTLIYFLPGYFVYAFLYALTGSTVSKPEDIQSANTPVVLLTMIGFYLAYFTLTDPTGGLNFFAALFPFSSPFCMPLRVMMGLSSIGEVLLSIGLLIFTCIIVAHIATRIYSNAILNYGSKMGWKNIIKLYKEK